MGRIKKILENELVGGTQSTDIYPVTSIKAVYDENNVRLDDILKPATRESAGLMSPEDKNNIELVQTELAGKVDKASVVQESGDSEELIMSQKAVTDELNILDSNKFDKNKVAQESGDSEELVMSQKAISDKLSNLSSTISEVNDKADTASTKASNALTKAEENKETLTTATSDISMLKEKVDSIPANIPKIVNMSESAYDALETKESDTYYMLTEE